jgi:hypothetical protein
MNTNILTLFNGAIPSSNNVDFATANKVAMKYGYIIHPNVCQEDVLDWVKNQSYNPNTTFYKTWGDITSKSRFELYADQVLHYASTYGTNHEGTPYIPNNDVAQIPFNQFKVLVPLTREQVIEKCVGMLVSGIALKQETINMLITICDELGHNLDVHLVKNREAKMYLHKKTGTLPNDAQEMVRYLIYLATDKTLLIKDKKTIQKIKESRLDISKLVSQFGEKQLASVFYRNKPLFLAFKRCSHKNSNTVNRLRKLAEKYHVPTTKTVGEQILSNPSLLDKLPKVLETMSNFKKVTLLETINRRKQQIGINPYVVRNQKIFIKEGTQQINEKYLNVVYALVYESLINSLSKKACKVKLPVGVTLTLPTSEKSFVGNYPLGTSFDFSTEDAIFGINWRGSEGARDLDLKMIDIDGNVYGWNAAYTNSRKSVIYSGDMTSANPEATELFYAKNGFSPAIMKVNLFGGAENSKFKFFLAKEKVKLDSYGKVPLNYMVNPNNILFTVDSQMDSKEKSMGVFTESKFVLAQFRTGKGKVAYNSVTDLYTKYALKTMDCYLDMKSVLKDAGFSFTDVEPDIDLTDLSKDTLINLMR